MKIALIGANGQLGKDISRVCECIPLLHKEIEITDPEQIERVMGFHEPDFVINTAAFRNPGECENDPAGAFAVNAVGVFNLAQVCKKRKIGLVQVSTDYVFDGQKETPYIEWDSPNPLNAYGISKLAGEFFAKQIERFYIVRVASLFGTSGCRGKDGENFIELMLKSGKSNKPLSVTSNIISSPTYTVDAAQQIKKLLMDDFPSGIYHATNAGQCSWREFALEIFKQSGLNVRVESREEKVEIAGIARPLYSSLVSTKLSPIRNWKEALRAYLKERKEK